MSRLVWTRPLLALTTLAALAIGTSSLARERESLLARAVSCQVDAGAVATLPSALAAEDPGMKSAAQSFSAPTGNLYRLTAPVSALGYSAQGIYISPGRIAMVVSGRKPAAVAARLKLTPDPYGPAERRIDDTHRLVAYELHQGDLEGKVLIGCEYGDPAALGWLAGDAAF